MPFPLLAAVPAIIVWARNALAAGGLISLLSQESVEELWETLKALIVAYVARVSGLNLDPDNPFSDSSLAGAVSERVGIPIRSLKDRALITEDLNNFAAELISQKSGFMVHSVTDVAVLKEDLLRIGAAEMTSRLGFPVGVMPGDGEVFDPAEIRKRLLMWAKAEILAEMSEDVQANVLEMAGAGNIDALADELNLKLKVAAIDKVVTARQISVAISNTMAAKAVGEYQSYVLSASKLDRKRVLNRAAQAKFRAAHGNRQQYVPLGMTATIT